MDEDQVSGFRQIEKSDLITGFRQILENVSPERIDMLVNEIGEIRDRMAEHAKTLVDQTSFRGEIRGSMGVIKVLAGAALAVGIVVGGAIANAILSLNELKSHMAEMPSPVQLELMKENIADMRDRINNLENRPNMPSNPTNLPTRGHH